MAQCSRNVFVDGLVRLVFDAAAPDWPWFTVSSALTWLRFLLKKKFRPALKFRLSAVPTEAHCAVVRVESHESALKNS